MPKLTFLGHSAFKIEGNGLVGLIDPFLTNNPQAAVKASELEGINYIFLTHTHGDHLGDTVAIAKRCGAVVFTNAETAAWLMGQGVKCEGMQVGGALETPFGRVKQVPALHGNPLMMVGKAQYAGLPCGYVIEVEGKKVYHTGDTALISDMQLLQEEKIDVALLPIGGYYTMDAHDAARAVGMIQPVVAVPMHYDTFPKIKCNPEKFAEEVSARSLLGTEIVILAPGQSLEY